MPRLENCGVHVDAYCRKTNEGSSIWDVCKECASTVQYDQPPGESGLFPWNGDPMGDHVGEMENWNLYTEDEYSCEICGKRLGEDDE